MFLRSEFIARMREHLFTGRIVDLEEDTLMAFAMCKDMERWYEKEKQVVERVDYISSIQQGSDTEEHDIQVLKERSLDRIRKSGEYWEKISQEPHHEIQEKWAKCEKTWIKIIQVMKDIRLPEFITLDDFVDLCEIVKSHTEKDSAWTKEIAKVTNMEPGQVQHFMEHSIKAQAMLQQVPV
jgi:hypothetical protein